MRFGYLFIVLLLIATLGAGAVYLVRRIKTAPEPETPVVRFMEQKDELPYQVTIVQTSGAARQVVFCERRACTPQPLPTGASEDAVTDGQAWYYYADVESVDAKTVRRVLYRHIPGEEPVALIEATPLTSPRGLYMSPDGKRLAFWLDNVDDPTAHLTELWEYDVEQRGVRLVAEKLYMPDIRSRVRWNRASTHLFFLADVGKQSEAGDTLALVVVQVQPPRATEAFAAVAWDELGDVVAGNEWDISPDGALLAYGEPLLFGRHRLLLVRAEGVMQSIGVSGAIPYMQWVEGNALVYVVQERGEYSFWRWQGAKHHIVARRAGKFHSAHADPSGTDIVFAAASQGQGKLYSLSTASGAITEQVSIPVQAGHVHVVQMRPALQSAPRIAAVTTQLTDSELMAIIEKNSGEMVSEVAVQLRRVVVTDRPNTVFVDYTGAGGQERRALITVHDALQREWSLAARYVRQGGEWQKIQGGGLQDPKPQRLYEWEEVVGKWILKSSNP